MTALTGLIGLTGLIVFNGHTGPELAGQTGLTRQILLTGLTGLTGLT